MSSGKNWQIGTEMVLKVGNLKCNPMVYVYRSLVRWVEETNSVSAYV